MIVLAVMGALTGIVFFGLHSFNNGQSVANAQKAFITEVRSGITKVDNGANGLSVRSVILLANGADGYYVDGTKVSLPKGVTISKSSNPSSVMLFCLANKNLSDFDLPTQPNGCSGTYKDSSGNNITVSCPNGATGAAPTQYFVCSPPNTKSSLSSVTVTFTNGSTTKSVVVQGSGMRVNQVYAL